ncbi:MAG TPA: hypothetical protein VGE26_03620 [Sphingobacteriaceae bacterium]
MKYLTLWVLLLPLFTSAQMNEGARFTALGTSGVALKDVWAVEKNQAGLSDVVEITLSFNYEQRLMSQDISTQSALLAIPHRRNVFAFGFQRYGFSAYNQQRASLNYARNLGPAFSAGINFSYHQLKIAGYGSSNAFSAEAGFQYEVNENLTFGAHIANPSNSRFNTEVNGGVPVALAFGVAYSFSDRVSFSADIEKVMDLNTDLKVGLEYEPVRWLLIRGGLSANPFRQYAGVGAWYQNIRIDAAVASEMVTGYSPQIGLSYAF